MQDIDRAISVLIVNDDPQALWRLTDLIDGAWPTLSVIGTARSIEAAQYAAHALIPDVLLLEASLGRAQGLEHIPSLVISRDGPWPLVREAIERAGHRPRATEERMAA